MGGVEATRQSLVVRINAELERYDNAISLMGEVLTAVLTPDEVVNDSVPQESAQSELHSLLLTLENLNRRFEGMRSRVLL